MVLKTPYLASVEMRLPTKFNQISNELGKFKLKKVVNSSESIGATFSVVVLQHNQNHNALMFL